MGEAHLAPRGALRWPRHHCVGNVGLATPKRLSGDLAGKRSRQITKKHHLVYEIRDTEVVVLVLVAYGHYDDK
ncbi:MAG: type II toxin-antitoxin system YoeB family toxin [Muribaculaceae bacterium]|nr:type II toxin-antitoxin system YoeB family toxin [Muribaculaceae bacterium]